MELLDVSRGTIQNYRKDGILSYSQLAEGGKILYPREQIEAFLQEHLVQASEQMTKNKELNPFFRTMNDHK